MSKIFYEIQTNYPPLFEECGGTKRLPQTLGEKRNTIYIPAAPERPVLVEIRQAGKWKDIISAGTGQWCVSQKVADDIRENDLTGLTLHPAEIVGYMPHSGKKPKDAPPPYYWVNVFPAMPAEALDQNGEKFPYDEESNLFVMTVAELTQMPGKKIVFKPEGYRDMPPWDGRDFFQLSTLEAVTLFCTERAAEVGRKNKWSNFYFNQAGEGNSFAF